MNRTSHPTTEVALMLAFHMLGGVAGGQPDGSLEPVRALALFPAEIDGTTVTINGIDTRRPTTAFTFDWGDGTETEGWFPQTHLYQDVSRNCKVTVVADCGATQAEATVPVVFISDQPVPGSETGRPRARSATSVRVSSHRSALRAPVARRMCTTPI